MKPDSDSWQLERLSALEDPELTRSLAVMKQQVPDMSQLAALAAQLSAQGLPVSHGPTLAASGVTALRKYSLIAGAALVGIGGAILWLRPAPTEPRLPPSTAV